MTHPPQGTTGDPLVQLVYSQGQFSEPDKTKCF